MRVVKPIKILPSMYTANDFFPEALALPDWQNFVAYTALDLVKHEGFVYKALSNIAIPAPGEVNPSPENDPINWELQRPVGTHEVFDNQTSSVSKLTAANTPVGEYYIDFSSLSEVMKVDTIGIFNISGITRVSVTVTDIASSVIYQNEVTLENLEVLDWYDYFFADSVYTPEAVFDNIPPALAYNYFYSIKFFNDNAGPASTERPYVGTIVLGKSFDIGQTQLGANSGIIDYSKKVTDDFGNTTFVQRAFSKKIRVSVMVENQALTKIFSTMSAIRATPCLWLGTRLSEYSPLNVFGYYKDFTIDIQYPKTSLVSLDIEGLA